MPNERYDRCPKLSQAYIPFQMFTTRYDPSEALSTGTVFPELYMPYHYRGGKCAAGETGGDKS